MESEKNIIFWGTIYNETVLNRPAVRYLRWQHGEWIGEIRWLVPWGWYIGGYYPAAVLSNTVEV